MKLRALLFIFTLITTALSNANDELGYKLPSSISQENIHELDDQIQKLQTLRKELNLILPEQTLDRNTKLSSSELDQIKRKLKESQNNTPSNMKSLFSELNNLDILEKRINLSKENIQNSFEEEMSPFIEFTESQKKDWETFARTTSEQYFTEEKYEPHDWIINTYEYLLEEVEKEDDSYFFNKFNIFPIADTYTYRIAEIVRQLTETNTEELTKDKVKIGYENINKNLQDYFKELDLKVEELNNNHAELIELHSEVESNIKEYKNKIREAIDTLEQRSDLNSNLILIIFAIGLLGIGTIAVIRMFPENVIQEWVESGQVIQFITVLIILSVVLALGIADRLSQDTLGTLLGAIGGYVLSQGVGKAATSKAMKAMKKDGPDKTGDKNDQGKESPNNSKPTEQPEAS